MIGDGSNSEKLLCQFDHLLHGKLDEHAEPVTDGGWFEDRWWLDRVLRPQVLFLTRDNRIGVGPPNLELGDVKWIFSGANHTFLLRPGLAEAENSEQWGFIRDCFVYGIMWRGNM